MRQERAKCGLFWGRSLSELGWWCLLSLSSESLNLGEDTLAFHRLDDHVLFACSSYYCHAALRVLRYWASTRKIAKINKILYISSLYVNEKIEKNITFISQLSVRLWAFGEKAKRPAALVLSVRLSLLNWNLAPHTRAQKYVRAEMLSLLWPAT